MTLVEELRNRTQQARQLLAVKEKLRAAADTGESSLELVINLSDESRDSLQIEGVSVYPKPGFSGEVWCFSWEKTGQAPPQE